MAAINLEENEFITLRAINALTQYICNDNSSDDIIHEDSEVFEYVSEMMRYPECIFNISGAADIIPGVTEVISEKIIAIHKALRIGDIYIAIGDILNYLPEGRFAENIIKRWNVSTIINSRKIG